MPKLSCPKCNLRIQVAADRLGRPVYCSSCGGCIWIPPPDHRPLSPHPADAAPPPAPLPPPPAARVAARTVRPQREGAEWDVDRLLRYLEGRGVEFTVGARPDDLDGVWLSDRGGAAVQSVMVRRLADAEAARRAA